MTDGCDDEKSKVDRVIQAYGLAGLGDDLEQKWTREEGERQSLRDLADYFNQEVLRAELEQADLQTSEWELERSYQILTDKEVGPSERMERKRALERRGVEVDDILQNFVSHQTIHTYLTEHRNVSRPDNGEINRAATAKRAINRIQSRTTAVVESNVERLESTGDLVVSDMDVLVSVEVYCNDCGISKPFSELVDEGGCGCRDG